MNKFALFTFMGAVALASTEANAANGSAFNSTCDIDSVSSSNGGRHTIKYDLGGCSDFQGGLIFEIRKSNGTRLVRRLSGLLQQNNKTWTVYGLTDGTYEFTMYVLETGRYRKGDEDSHFVHGNDPFFTFED